MGIARIAVASAALMLMAGPVFAQTALLKMDHLDRLAGKATQVIDVTVGEQLLQLASGFLSAARSPNEKEIKELVRDLKGVYVKRFEFDQEGQYSEAELEPLRRQLRGPGWARIVGVIATKEPKNIEVFMMTEGTVIKGISVVAAEPRELTVVNVVGPIDIDKLSRLQGQFGIPDLELKGDGSKGR